MKALFDREDSLLQEEITSYLFIHTIQLVHLLSL